MGNRRMFSLKVINTAKFLRLPIDTQNLYFHLGLRADDDGVVEAYPVIRLIGASEDSLKILHAKNLVEILNEDLVAYITDWKEHNTIRADRKIDSIYKDLLVKIIPDVELLESKKDLKNRKVTTKCLTSGNQMSDNLPTDCGQIGNKCPPKLREVKLSEVKLSEVKAVVVPKIDLCETEKTTPLLPEKTYQENIGLLTQHIAERIKALIDDGVSEELLSKYIQVSVERNKKTWSYIEKMAIGNLEKNIKTLEQYNASQLEREKTKAKQIITNLNIPQHVNFDQREPEDDYSKYYYKVPEKE